MARSDEKQLMKKKQEELDNVDQMIAVAAHEARARLSALDFIMRREALDKEIADYAANLTKSEKDARRKHDDRVVDPSEMVFGVDDDDDVVVDFGSGSSFMFLRANSAQVQMILSIFRDIFAPQQHDVKEDFKATTNKKQTQLHISFGSHKPQEYMNEFLDLLVAIQRSEMDMIPDQFRYHPTMPLYLGKELFDHDTHRQLVKQTEERKYPTPFDSLKMGPTPRGTK